jgi:class 3 adenylate cyclase
MLRAIAELAGAAQVAAEAAPTTEPRPGDTAERRQLTVMFCDLVGSTALSTRLDPEDLRQVISAYHKCVADTVALFDGFVAKYMGDGVLVYFGYPRAYEDNAERAVRIGLALVDAVGRLAERSLEALTRQLEMLARGHPALISSKMRTGPIPLAWNCSAKPSH